MSSYHQHVSLKQLTMNSKFAAYWMYFFKKKYWDDEILNDILVIIETTTYLIYLGQPRLTYETCRDNLAKKIESSTSNELNTERWNL